MYFVVTYVAFFKRSASGKNVGKKLILEKITSQYARKQNKKNYFVYKLAPKSRACILHITP